MNKLRMVFNKIFSWAVPLLIGIIITAAWQYISTSRPKLCFSFKETKIIITDISGEELKRYLLEVWHTRDEPLSSVTLVIKPSIGLTKLRIRFENQEKWIDFTKTDRFKQVIAENLQVQKRMEVILDANVSITSDQVALSSQEVQGFRYVPLWREPLIFILLLFFILWIPITILLFLFVNWLLGLNLVEKLKEAHKEQKKLTNEIITYSEKFESLVINVKQRILEILDSFKNQTDSDLEDLDNSSSQQQSKK